MFSPDMTSPTDRTLDRSRLVIGVPTVPRHSDYVERTVDSIVAGIPPGAWNRVEIVVFDATQPPVRHAAVARIEARYREQIELGRLTILRNECGYPQLQVDPVGGTDREEPARRSFWQRKLVLDFVHLARFCAQRGDYYLHVEDDSIATVDFLEHLTKWFDADFAERDDWAFLTLFTFYRTQDGEAVSLEEFFSACALLFRADDVSRVTHHCEEHLSRNGLDFLLAEFAGQEGRAVFASSPPLFQHIGLFSSFEGETRTIQAAWFAEGRLRVFARGLGEATALLRRDPAAMAEFLRSRLTILAPPLLSLVRSWRRLRDRITGSR
jgi:N-Acetylglucosaminyltransferase-IV (GnT-IV) conserved region